MFSLHVCKESVSPDWVRDIHKKSTCCQVQKIISGIATMYSNSDQHYSAKPMVNEE